MNPIVNSLTSPFGLHFGGQNLLNECNLRSLQYNYVVIMIALMVLVKAVRNMLLCFLPLLFGVVLSHLFVGVAAQGVFGESCSMLLCCWGH